MSEFHKINYRVEDGVAIISLNDDKAMNAMGREMGEETLRALARAPREARALLLTSEGRAFCSGANLTDGGVDLSSPDIDMGLYLDTLYNPIIRVLRDLEIPLVVAMRGAAAGVGASIAMMGDIIVAGERAYFLQAFCHLGLVPDGGSPYLLAKAVGRVRAMELMLLGERYPAREAHADGLITRVVADDDVDQTAMDYARRLAAGPTRAYSLIRKSAWAALDASLDEQLQRERALQRHAGRTKDFIEGVSAFFQKRKAEFSGE